MKNIIKRLGLKADATEQDVDAAIEALQLKFAQASEAVAKVDELVKENATQAARIAELEDSKQSVAESLGETVESLLNKQGLIDEVTILVLGNNGPVEDKELLAAIQTLKEQPSNGQSNAIVQGLSEPEARKKAKEALSQFEDEDKCFVTTDGQCFFREHHARNHSISIKGDYFKFER